MSGHFITKCRACNAAGRDDVVMRCRCMGPHEIRWVDTCSRSKCGQSIREPKKENVMKPTVGRIVHFRLTAEQANGINEHLVANRGSGNRAQAGDVLPFLIVRVWQNEYPSGARLCDHPADTLYESHDGVNGQAFLDGPDNLWITSAPQHSTLPGCWFWPPRES